MSQQKTPIVALTEKTLRKLAKLYNQTSQMLYAFSHGLHEEGYQMALENEREAERLILEYRNIPICIGRPSALMDIETVMSEEISVEIGYSKEGWFVLRMPELLPLKEKNPEGYKYIRGYLYPALERHFRNEVARKIDKCVIIYRHIYNREFPEKEYRDHDNIEVNFVTDAIAMFVMIDDSSNRCELYQFSDVGDENKTEVYVVPQKDFDLFRHRIKKEPDNPITIVNSQTLFD